MYQWLFRGGLVSGRIRAGRDYIIGILQKYSIPLCFGVPWFGTAPLELHLIRNCLGTSRGVLGIGLEQCARRELFKIGTLDSDQRHLL